MSLILRNPHSVLAALETRSSDVLSVTVPAKAMTDAWEKVAQLARECRIPVNSSSPFKKDSRPHKSSGRSGAGPSEESTRMSIAEASIRERTPISIEELFRDAAARTQGHGLWLALDGLQDPHNVGAIFRAAAFFGIQGILLTQERSASLTATVYDVASGGVEYVPFAIQSNFQRSFEEAKSAGLWILGTSEHCSQSYQTIEKDRSWLLVLGNEEKGMRRLTQECCDVLCCIPPNGQVTSLNVSVAAGILMSRLS